MATKTQVGSAPGVFQKRTEAKTMAQMYRRNHIGQTQGYRFQEPNNCAPQKEAEPIYVDIPFFMDGIERDGSKTLHLMGEQVLRGVRSAEPREFIFAGSSNLWLMPGSSINGRHLIGAAMPLDTFRLGAPNKVSWPPIDTYSGIMLVVENRCPARNGGSGRFIARLSCVASPQQAPF